MDDHVPPSTSIESAATERPLVSEPTTSIPLTRLQSSDREGIRPRTRKTGTGDSHHTQRRSTDGTLPPRRFSLQRVVTNIMKPEKKVGAPPSVWQSSMSILKASWLNVLLIFIPVSWALHFALAGKQDTVIFVCSFLAIIPLAKLLAFATDELSMRVGQTLAGLLNATLGNAVELIVAIIALVKCELQIVQSSLIGSILSNLLLVLGMCFFAGGLKFQEQGFGLTSSQINASLLTISVIAVLLPAAFHFSVTGDPNNDEKSDILNVSHGVAIILLFIYLCYLVFQLFSHSAVYADEGDHVSKTTNYEKNPFTTWPRSGNGVTASPNTTTTTDLEAARESGETPEEDVEMPQLSVVMTIGLLVVVTVFVALTAEFLVDAIDGMTDTGNISKEFVGVILLPIVGNAAEHVTAVTVSVKDKLNLSIGVAVGSSIQIALFVIPFIVTLAWMMGKPLTMLFDPYESVTLFLAVLTVNYVVQDGKSNWLEGMILMCLYIILGVTFWFYPGVDTNTAIGIVC